MKIRLHDLRLHDLRPDDLGCTGFAQGLPMVELTTAS